MLFRSNLETALQKLDKTIEEDYNQIREIFLHPDVVTDYDLKFKNPKREKLIDFLCGDHDFTEERTFAAIDKLVQETAQTSLEQWF